MAKKIVTKMILIAGVLLIADGLFLTVTTNINIGTLMVLLAGTVFAAYGIWHKKIAEITAKGLLRILKYVMLAALVFMLCLIAFLVYEGRSGSVTYKEDAVIVLGAAIHGDQVSRSLAHRLDKTVEYSEKNPNSIIVVSGGQGPQEAVTEASAMETYLVGKGISKERIIKEEKATSTYENFKYSREQLDSHFSGSYTCVYVTNDFHLYRSGCNAKLAGIQAKGLGAYTDWYNVPASYLRESLATIKFWILKK